MSANAKTVSRAVAVLGLPTKVALLITYVQGIVTAMTGNPSFPNPTPALAAISAALATLQTAETAALTRARGTAVTRNEKRATLVALLVQLRAYIQAQADAAVEHGASIIASAGIAVRRPISHGPHTFGAKPGPTSGTVKLVAEVAARRASYEWQYSTDGGKTWLEATPTLRSSTTISGLPAGTAVLFRYRAVTTTGTTDWSAPTSLMVL
jgi:hypothetical protein